MTNREKQEFLRRLQARLAKLESEVRDEIEDSEPDMDPGQMDETAKDCVFMVEDFMNAVEA